MTPIVLDASTAKSSKFEDFLGKEAHRDKGDQARFSVVGCSYVHGLSDGQAVAHIKPLYSRYYLYEIGMGWEQIFLM